MTQKRTLHGWGAALSIKDEPLTLAEAQALASLMAADRLMECLAALQNVEARLTRLELYVRSRDPEYDGRTHLALTNGRA